MAAKVFRDILEKGTRAGMFPGRDKESREWYRGKARAIKKKHNENLIMRNAGDRLKNQVAMGSMYMFYYDPKHKATLPYYDMFPLVFPFAKTKEGFLGINLHYLPYQMRAVLMDALYDISNNDRMDDTTKLKLSYGILKNASKYRFFKPCIKHYLKKHVRSRFAYVHPSEWDVALFLPISRWEKASQQKVWADSKKIINGS
ncbi:putative DNA end protector protein [Sinorhizobium phage phiM7]|uniref:DNA end protector protein n=3 Tax=Emdodecavirus TaxID=1980937 RepID=A0A0F6WCM7_9CAUD|nr:DNA end protector [Sinorhizobium phage phiM12]YP_009212357.1 DNA end protector [Sinorhizobium phage phiN3]YP_009601228.1 DNA end protector [Sinorhizobium phage phiM7]AKF13010.1 putative DNA end protector protein [Sinorhizobium phage phiM19]AGR47789.2 putative DNA end protector protein [Sinorhizobium phage phiM12]AKF12650.1 putative DNA end protector protein [Sinorhizobium phage phiM7]AKF13382.2 DNA end protector protein [Sinorhizobium phage phiN3]